MKFRKIELLSHLIKLVRGCCLQRCNQLSGLCNTSSLVDLLVKLNVPALMKPFAIAWAIFPPPMNPDRQ